MGLLAEFLEMRYLGKLDPLEEGKGGEAGLSGEDR